MTAQWRVTIDPDRCIGSGTCGSIAPQRFRLTPAQISEPTAELIAADDAVLEAAEMCPAAAITVALPVA